MIYGFLEDNIGYLILSHNSFSIESSSEFLFFKIYLYFLNFINPSLLYNLYIVFIFLLNFIVSIYFFKFFLNSSFVSVILSLLVTFSPYSLYQSQNHPVLMNIWIIYLFIIICFKLIEGKGMLLFILSGLFFGSLTSISNYLGFFGLLFSFIYLGINNILQIYLIIQGTTRDRSMLLKTFVLFISSLFTILLFNYRFVEVNLISRSEVDTNYYLKRSIDDFFIFSSRPWYYLIPSIDNPFYGGYSYKILQLLETSWGNFLVKNYFKSEHSASFLGIFNIILAIFGFYYISKNKNNIKKFQQLLILGVVAIILIFFTMPPYLNLGWFTVYFPSYLIAEYFSMFRVLSRLGIFILIIQLIFTGYGYINLIEILRFYNVKTIYYYSVCLLIFSISLSEFFIPFKFTDTRQTPDAYSFLKDYSDPSYRLAVFPRGKYIESSFWSKDPKIDIVDLEKNHIVNSKKILKDAFYNHVAFTCEGLEILRSYGVSHILYFYNLDQNSEKKIEFFNRNLDKINEFKNISLDESYGNSFYKIINTGNTYSNQSVLFKISNNNCKN